MNPPASRLALPRVPAELSAYVPSDMHDAGRRFRETNCYTDIWIEVLHAAGHTPAACMAFTLAVDFEGDQWTFFKPPPDDLELLYGIDVHETQIYRPILDHACDLLDAAHTMTVEVDAFHLPDTRATSYGREHVKTTIAFAAISPARDRIRYFHNAGLWEATGDDVAGLFPADPLPGVLPPYAELIRFDAGPPPTGEDLTAAVVGRVRHHLARTPRTNPWNRFGDALEDTLPRLREDGGEGFYHAYAFATLRQVGAAAECAASLASWLAPHRVPAATAATAFTDVADACTAMLFRMARRRPFDTRTPTERCAQLWDTALAAMADAADA